MSLSLDAYQAWRQRQEPDCLLHDRESRHPDETLLQAIWQHQRFRRNELRTVAGERIEVLHPGFWNHGPGPDFSQAIIRWGNGKCQQGDVEIDCEASGWQSHHHDRNPHFSDVMLQVVWRAPHQVNAPRAILALENVLDSPISELAALFAEEHSGMPPEFQGKCQAPLLDLSIHQVRDLLRAAATLRFRHKAFLLEARARQVGWQLGLWEGLLGGLGYSKNSWPLRRLAELTPLIVPGFSQGLSRLSGLEIEARFFGVAGFLPRQVANPPSGYVTQLWDIWWRIRDQFVDQIFPRAMWRLPGSRPHNHPHRRLALASLWTQRADFFDSIEWWFTTTADDACLENLEHALFVVTPPFWRSRFHFGRVSHGVSPNLLGRSRMIDLLINVILPWFWVRARAGNNGELMRRAEQLFFVVPRAEENRLLRDARKRLMGRCDPKLLATAADQQGLLQVLRDFCAHSNSLCHECRFPKLVASCAQAVNRLD